MISIQRRVAFGDRSSAEPTDDPVGESPAFGPDFACTPMMPVGAFRLRMHSVATYEEELPCLDPSSSPVPAPPSAS